MWEDLCDCICLGDFFKLAMRKLPYVHRLVITMDCENYSRAGDKSGMNGATGWMMVAAIRWVCMMDDGNRPLSIGLETADYDVHIHDGHEVRLICEMLEEKYVVYRKVIQVAPYGSVSHRERLLINAFDKTMPGCGTWLWPQGNWGEHHPHCARDIADKDKDVEVERRMPADFTVFCPAYYKETVPAFGQMQKLARVSYGKGFSDNPHLHLGLDGCPNGPTRYGGFGTRGSTLWKPGMPITCKCKWSLKEFYRLARLPDSAEEWQEQWRQEHTWKGNTHKTFDNFLRAGVNQGYPVAVTYCMEGTIARHMLAH